MLYGSNENKKNVRPIVLPPLQIVHLLGTYDPIEGLRHLICRPRPGYVGERDEDSGKLHGMGVYTYANGDVYRGGKYVKYLQMYCTLF